MTCLACHWIHTSPDAAIACYRRAVPDPVSASSSARTRPVDLAEVSITAGPDELAAKAARGGRPRRHASDLVARREAQRAYRRRRAGARA